MAGEILLRILSDPIAIVLVVLFFGASIFVHELGHYLAARWRGLRIERFSIGFGPRLLGWKDKQGVDWRLSLIPLGGYVALPQLADMRGAEGESQYTKESLPPLSYTDKMVVSAAGAFFNVIFALLLGTILWGTGIPVPGQQETTKIGYIVETVIDEEGNEREAPAAKAGLQPGDQILKIDGKTVDNWEDITYAITTGIGRGEFGGPKTEVTISRPGLGTRTFDLFPILSEDEGIRRLGILPAVDLVVGETMQHSPAASIGLQPGDRIVEVNGQPVFHTISVSQLIEKNKEGPIPLTIEREDSRYRVKIIPEEVAYTKSGETTPMIGVRWQRNEVIKHINPFEQIHNAVSITLQVLGALIHPKSDIGINNLSGPVGISYTLYVLSQIGILEVLSIVVLININLAILNLLPIPVLDGGHMAFATLAKLRGKPIPANLIASAQGAFMLIFLAIFVYVTFFDFARVERNETALIEAERARQERIPIEFQGIEQPSQSALEASSR